MESEGRLAMTVTVSVKVVRRSVVGEEARGRRRVCGYICVCVCVSVRQP